MSFPNPPYLKLAEELETRLKESGADHGNEFDAAIAAAVDEAPLAVARRLFIAKAVAETKSIAIKEHAEAAMERSSLRISALEASGRKMATEKAILFAEINKVTSVKDKLQELCRELQKQNKLVVDEAKERVEREIRLRSELTDKFKGSLDDVTGKYLVYDFYRSMMIII